MPSATDRALSTPAKLLTYGLLGLLSLVVVLAAVSVALRLLVGVIGLLFGVVSLAVSVGFLFAVGYAAYWAVSQAMTDDPATAETAQTETTGEEALVDRLTERYANGELTEAELERKLEQALDDPSLDDTESLERERELK